MSRRVDRATAVVRSSLRLAVLTLVAAWTTVSGAAATDFDLESAAKAERQGDSVRAAEAYLRVLRLQPGHRKARSGLDRVALPAVEVRFAASSELENATRFADAHDELLRARDLARRLTEAGALQPGAVDLQPIFDRLTEHWIEDLDREATQAYREGLWSAAITDLARIEELRPGSERNRERLVDAWTQWGRSDIEAGRYRAAAERFAAASAVPGRRRDLSARRAGAILERLATDALERGACRRALADFSRADHIDPGSVDTMVRDQARICAATCLVLNTTAGPEPGLESGLIELIGTRIRADVDSSKSEHLRLVDRSGSRDSVCTASMVSADGAQVIPNRIRVSVEIDGYAFIRAPATSRNREHRTTDPVTGRQTVVIAREYEEQLSATLTGSIALSRPDVGGVGLTLPISESGGTTIRWTKGPVSAVTMVDRSRGSTAGPDRPPVIDVSLVEDRRTEARRRLRTDLIERFSVRAAQTILDIVDRESAGADPTRIELDPELFVWTADAVADTGAPE